MSQFSLIDLIVLCIIKCDYQPPQKVVKYSYVYIVVVQLLSHVRLFATSWTVAR